MGKSVKRLFNEFKPKHYLLELTPNKASMTFTGQLIVNGQKSGRPSQRLTFHQNGLTVTKAHVTKHDKTGDNEALVDRINTHNAYDEVRLHTKNMLYPGNYTVRLEFKGKITKQMNGMYPCYFEENGTEKSLLATQFESHHAREAFPCIDEPEAKATFQLTLLTDKDEIVLSNTPVKHQTITDNHLRTEFEITPHMSTYLVAFVVGEVGFLEATTKDGVLVRTYATANNVEFTRFALETAVRTLEFYNDYFGIDYPLKKCDMIALPDFASGAMENWGLITYREQTMLIDPANSTLTTKQYVAMVVAHELAHQWFGNLVTMRWWTDLWLNEGFASWIEYLAVDHMFPQWQMWTQFAVDEQHRALKLDALEHTHPIEVTVHHPDEIRTIFDTISYSKGASIIHMLHEYLGPTAFRDGLRHYLATHKYGSTDTVDLWAALEEISGKKVREFMHAWTSKPGFPLLNATITDTELTLSQERFYLNPEHPIGHHTSWPIALLANVSDVPELLTTKTQSVQLHDPKEIKLNRGQSGFYRVAYNATHLQRLGELIQKGHLSALNRLGILSDVFETAKAGKTDTAEALHFLEHFREESNSAVWDVIAASIGSVRGTMDDENLREDMKPFIRNLTAKQFLRLGWEIKKDESHFDQLLRPLIVGLSAAADQPEVVKESLGRFENMKTPEDIHPDLRNVVYATAVRHGDQKTFDKLFALHEASTLSEERTSIAVALTGFKQPDIVEQALSLIKSDSVRLQDVSYWIAYSFMNRYSRDATWKWMTKHWEWLGENLGTDLSFYRFPMYAANAYSSRKFLEKFNDFFIPRRAPAFERSINQGIEVLQWQSAWKERDLKEVKTFFKAHLEK
ncbi:M1 family metallopeptidase [Candidatus Saccharibacteria bacterium]|nr:M1 family metallopeptidase [Candidatus Saccharibacteria bacterium]